MKRKYVIYDQTFISLLFLSANVLVYRFVIVLAFRATFLSPLVTLTGLYLEFEMGRHFDTKQIK